MIKPTPEELRNKLEEGLREDLEGAGEILHYLIYNAKREELQKTGQDLLVVVNWAIDDENVSTKLVTKYLIEKGMSNTDIAKALSMYDTYIRKVFNSHIPLDKRDEIKELQDQERPAELSDSDALEDEFASSVMRALIKKKTEVTDKDTAIHLFKKGYTNIEIRDMTNIGSSYISMIFCALPHEMQDNIRKKQKAREKPKPKLKKDEDMRLEDLKLSTTQLRKLTRMVESLRNKEKAVEQRKQGENVLQYISKNRAGITEEALLKRILRIHLLHEEFDRETIAKATETASSGIARLLGELPIEERRKIKKEDKVVNAYNFGMSIKEISNLTGRSSREIWRTLKIIEREERARFKELGIRISTNACSKEELLELIHGLKTDLKLIDKSGELETLEGLIVRSKPALAVSPEIAEKLDEIR